VTFTSLIDGYVLHGNLDHAFLLFRRMVNVSCKPNYRTYNVLLKGLQKECKLLTENVVAEHKTVYSCSSDKRDTTFEILYNLLTRLSEIGCEPTADTYSILVRGLCREGKSWEADQLIENMKERGLCPNQDIYNSILVAHCKNLAVDDALNIFNLMVIRGFELHLSIYKALICALCMASRLGEAQSLFESMLEKEWNNDEIVWTILVDGLLKEGQLDLCMKLLHVMKSRNCILNSHTYVILARELSKLDKSVGTHQISDNLRDLRGLH
jgi:pentatricopeptide repeat protein